MISREAGKREFRRAERWMWQKKRQQQSPGIFYPGLVDKRGQVDFFFAAVAGNPLFDEISLNGPLDENLPKAP